MNRGNFAIEHQQEAESAPYGTRDLPHLSVDITHDTRMPYGTKHLRVMPEIAHNYGKGIGNCEPEDKLNCCGFREGGGFEDFTRNDLRDIILHKNKVIADLEKHAYGSASWIDALNKGLKKANEIKGKVDKKPPKESDEEFRKRLEEFDKGSAPTEAWGADELDGGGVVVSKEPSREPPREPPKEPPLVRADGSNAAEITAGALTPEQKTIIKNALEYANEQATRATGWNDRMYPAELDRWVAIFRQNVSPELRPVVDENMPLIRQIANMRPDLRENYIDGIVDDIGRSLNRAISSSGKKPDAVYKQIKRSYGGAAAPTPTEPKVSPVAAAAAVLAPVREKIQNGIGDALYGKSDDPKKQKKGLLGISEEGKEESKKKVMKNIVVPIVKTAAAFGKSVKDTANRIFNPDQYDADMKEERIKRIKRSEAEAGIVRDKENPMLIIRKPAGLWNSETTDPSEKAYNEERIAHKGGKDVFYIRVPNPLFAAKLKPSFKELVNDAGVELWTSVNQYTGRPDVDGTLERLQNDPFIWIPEEGVKEKYAQLRQFVADKQDEEVAVGYEDEGWTKGDLKRFAKIDPRTLKGQELLEWKEGKLALDRAQTQNALEKVNKDIKDEEAREGRFLMVGQRPTTDKADQARLAKMREAKVRVEKRQKELVLRGQQEFKDRMMFENAEKAKRDVEYYAKQKADAQGTIDQADADKAEWEAKPVAEKIAILEGYIADPNANEMEIADFTEQLEQLRVEAASEKVEEQAQGSVDLLQQAEVIGAEGGADSESDEELEGAGAVEYVLQKAGMRVFNPSGDTHLAGQQSFTPDYDAYGEDEEQGRLNAFNLSASMYNQSKAIELPDFKLIQDDTSIRFYRKDDENVILVGVRGTDFQSWTDFYTWFVIGTRSDLRLTTRFQDDLTKLIAFQRNYPPNQFYYVATGHSLAGSIIDRFLEMGLIEEAITYNPAIEKKHLLDGNILNHRVYLDTDPLFILMGQYAPNTEIRVNPNKTNYYNPSKEKDYLIQSHLIYPTSNSALEGGGMEGSGKTYTLEEWKAIFDAKLEQKRKAIEAREAKKKQTAKAKRERAKGRREEREKPKAPEPEEEPEVECAEYKMGDEVYWVEEPREGLAFDERRVFDSDYEEIGNLTVDDVGKTLVKMVMRQEKIGAFADKPKSSSEDEPPPLEAPFRTSRVQKATPPKGEPSAPKKRKPKLKVVAPASARVELREELVAEQPRSPAGEFAVEVAVAQPRPMTALPRMTAKQKEFFMNLMSRNVSATQKSILLARSGMSDKLVERLLPFMTSSNKRAVMKQTGMITERVAEKRTDTDYPHLPADIKTGLRKLAQDIMNMKGRRPTMLDDARRTDTLKKMTETEKRQMLRRNFVAGVKSCEAVVSMTRTDMFGDYSCRRWEAGEPSYFKRVETSEYGVKKKCMAIGDDAGMPQGATLDQLKPVVGVGRDGAMMSSRMLCELSPSTWGVEDKPDAKFLSKGVPITKSTPDADLAEHIRQTQQVWRLCIWQMMDICGIKITIRKELTGTWKRGYGIIINWETLQKDDKNLTKAKVREAQQEIDEKLSSPKLRDFLLDLRGFCAMVAEETEGEDEGDVARRRKDEEEGILMRRMESEITPDEEEERAKVRANPELKAKLWEAIKRETGRLNSVFDTAPFSGNLRQRINRMKRIAGIDYNTGYGSVVPANFWVSGLKAKLPPIRKKDGYYPSVEQYIRDVEKQ